MKRSNRKYKKSHINRVNNKYNTCNWAGGLLRGAELWTVGQPGAWFKGASVGLGGLECHLYIPRLWHVHTKKAINNRFDIFGHCNWLPFPFPLAFPSTSTSTSTWRSSCTQNGGTLRLILGDLSPLHLYKSFRIWFAGWALVGVGDFQLKRWAQTLANLIDLYKWAGTFTTPRLCGSWSIRCYSMLFDFDSMRFVSILFSTWRNFTFICRVWI